MKHIKTLILDNFQQWKSGKIIFTEGLNVIVGNTESGKSTLFRAINSILTGKMPEDYIRKGTKGCEVKVEFGDNTTFRRLRNKKDNIVDANGLIFERVGKEIPSEYFNRLGKTSIEFGSKELSLCSYSQFEPHFFITLSDYDKSKLIGTICGIDIVDKLVDNINKDIRSNNSNVKFLEEQIKQENEQFKLKEPEYKLLDNKVRLNESKLLALQNNFKTLENLSNLSYKLSSLDKDISYQQTELNQIKTKIKDFSSVKVQELAKFYKLQQSLQSINKEISQELALKNKLKLDFSIDKTKIELLDDLVFLREKLVEYKENIDKNQEFFNKYKQELEKLKIEKKELLKDYDKCPLCGGIL